jgi:outer membrane protein OmpA-like peptidoglycan-associated protein
MNKVIGIAVLSIVLFVPSIQVHSQDTPDTEDHPLISRYTGSVIDGYEVQEFNEYTLALGPAIKTEDGDRVPSEKETLEGKITRILYRGPDDKSTLEIQRNYRMALEKAGFEILYTCSDKECGHLFFYRYRKIENTKTSGKAFDVPKDIRYVSAKKITSNSIVHVSVLIAIDGIWTKKPVTLVEVIESEPMETGMVTVNSDAMAESIESTGHIAIYGIYFDTGSATLKEESNSTLKEINSLLTKNPALNLLIVGHTDNQGSHDLNMDLSNKRANSVVNALVENYGINSDRLTPHGIGFLAPVSTNNTEDGRALNRRVELVQK